MKIPFLKPNLVEVDSYLPYLRQMHGNRYYTNYGPLNTQFEQQVLEQYFSNVGAVTTINNATSGLILAINAVKRSNSQYAVMPSFTFAATPLAAMWCGLTPYFVDVDPDTWYMNKELLNQVLNELGEEVSVVVPYATFGTCMDLSYYAELHQQGIPVVIDAAPGFGSCDEQGQHGLGFPGMVVYSLHATKPFGIGEGGLVYSSNPQLVEDVRTAANFSFDNSREAQSIGLNAKLPEISAAVALATLPIYQEKVKKRHKIHKWYLEEMQAKGMFEAEWKTQLLDGEIANQFLPVMCPPSQVNADYIKKLACHSIEARAYFSPACHQQKAFSSCKCTTMEVTNQLAQRIISLPLWEEMTCNDVKCVVDILYSAE